MNFDVGRSLSVEVEFKTSERDGVLLTVGSLVGDVGVTLELHNGKVGQRVGNDGARSVLRYSSVTVRLCYSPPPLLWCLLLCVSIPQPKH